MNHNVAIQLLEAGLSFVPVDKVTRIPVLELLPLAYDENGEPVIKTNSKGEPYHAHEYKTYMQRKPTQDEVMAWFGGLNDYNLAIIPGSVSGGLVIFDFDFDAETIFPKWQELVNEKMQGLISSLVFVRSGKGYHVYFRCPEFSHKNNAIARRPNKDNPKSPHILIEIKNSLPCTAPPSWHDGAKRHYRTIQGTLKDIATISLEQANTLLECALSLNEVEVKEYKPDTDKIKPASIIVANNGQIEGYRILAYSRAILRSLASDLAMMDGYRNATLNSSAFILGTWHSISGLSYGECEASLKSAGEQNRMIQDNGLGSFLSTMQSGWKAGLLQPKTYTDIQEIFQDNNAPMPAGELVARFKDVHPPLSEEQLSQVVKISQEIREVALWLGYHNGMKAAHKQAWLNRYGFSDGVLDIFGLGYREGYVDPETGEIISSAYTVPMNDINGNTVNVEYRTDSGEVRYQQETLPTASYLVNEYFPAMEDKPVLMFADTIEAMNAMLNTGTFNYAGLPQLPLIPETFDNAPNLQHILVIDPHQKRHNLNMRLLPKNTKVLRLPYEFSKLRPLCNGNNLVDFVVGMAK